MIKETLIWKKSYFQYLKSCLKSAENGDTDKELLYNWTLWLLQHSLVCFRLASWAIWMSPRPVRYLKEGTWTTKGVWNVQFHGEITGPWLSFCLEEPSVVGLAQARRINLPLQGWSLYPSQLRRTMLNIIQRTNIASTCKKPPPSEKRGKSAVYSKFLGETRAAEYKLGPGF